MNLGVQVRFCECEIEVVWVGEWMSVRVRLCELVSDFSRTWEPNEGSFMSVWVCVWEWVCVSWWVDECESEIVWVAKWMSVRVKLCGRSKAGSTNAHKWPCCSLVLTAVFSSLSNRLFTLTIHDTRAVSSVHQCQRLVTNSHWIGSECVPRLSVGHLCWYAAGVEFPSTSYSPKGPVSLHFKMQPTVQ